MMKNLIPTNSETLAGTTRIKNSVFHKKYSLKDPSRENLYRTLYNDGCEDFYNYIDWLDLAKSSDAIVIPASNSFFYMPDDLDNAGLVINLKPLNLVKDLESFLSKTYSFLPEYSYFTGCFEDYDSTTGCRAPINRDIPRKGPVINKNGKQPLSWIQNIINIIFDTGSKRYLTTKNLISLMSSARFTVLDTTRLNDKIYFCVQKRPPAEN